MALPTPKQPTPWYSRLVPGFTWDGFRVSSIGKATTHYLVRALEAIGLAPKGSLTSHTLLLRAADGLVKGGQLNIFTTMFFFLVRKPEK